MLKATTLFAIVCATLLVGLPAMAQAPAELTLTRIDCGTDAAPINTLPAFPAAAK